ncbi:hypothetical protein CHCC20372_2702 [Bacillus paralicheniformis]|nr:hypothetical protein CHCC20372_2702 [Bacillus paralicheniformis]
MLEKPIEQLLSEFVELRRQNLKNLRHVIDKETDFEQAEEHPEFCYPKLERSN